ncbi:MAG: cytochrome B5 [Actinobacteria bacterium]|nr:cytochrome B5 [Actinomycetota bacterium]
MEAQEFTMETLAKYDGKDGRPAYVAHDGKVYDLTSSPSWENGEHEDEHYAGRDLTEDMDFAPHLADELDNFPVVGIYTG